MSQKISYSHARNNFADIWNHVEGTREPTVIYRRHHEDMALIPLDDLQMLRETAHLMRSPKNAQRLLAALQRARQGKTPVTDLHTLRRDLDAET